MVGNVEMNERVSVNAIYFQSTAELRAWFDKYHGTVDELWIGYFKKASGEPSITHTEAIDEALCFGWIDGIRKSIDDKRFVNRFTPRRPRSNWSQVNITRVGELIELGRMTSAGLEAFESRDRSGPAPYSSENRGVRLDERHEAIFRANPTAWDFFKAQPPGYQRTATWWVMSAKKDETRLRRLGTLIEDSSNARRIRMLARPVKDSPNQR
jgi:uncharacterized protein YdeI (YjbR/CyaY-like superfamily)